MHDLVVIVPSRGRPEAAHELVQAFNHTATTGPRLVFAVGEDDPTLPEYQDLLLLTSCVELVVWAVDPTDRPSSMGWALNIAARAAVAEYSFAIGFLGDDHRPRTKGWDAAYLAALRDLGTGFVYGDDLYQGERLPTQWAMTADIVRALGYMTPPDLWHLFVDDFVRDLGRAAGCIRYLPDVVVEHLHPLAGKAAWDDSYRRSNAPEMYARDGAAYRAYLRDGFLADVAKVKALRAQVPA